MQEKRIGLDELASFRQASFLLEQIGSIRDKSCCAVVITSYDEHTKSVVVLISPADYELLKMAKERGICPLGTEPRFGGD